MSGIHEVARLSGVSVSTVSRVFNGYADVSETTRQRVLATAEQLDYTPSAAARTLVRRRSELIGVILYTGEEHPDIQHPFFQEVLVGLKHGIGELGYDLLLFATEQPGSNRGKPHSYLRRARHHRVDGVALMGVDLDDPEVGKLLASETPIIGVDLEHRRPARELRHVRQCHRRTARSAASALARAHASRHDHRPGGLEGRCRPHPRLPRRDAGARAREPSGHTSSRATSTRRAARLRCTHCWRCPSRRQRCSRPPT